MKTFLIVGGHDESFSYLKGMSVQFLVIQIAQMLGDEQRHLAKQISIVESFTNEIVLAAAKQLARKYSIDFIFSFTEDGLLPAAYCAQSLKIPGIDYQSCLLCRDKIVLRNHLKGSIFEIPAMSCTQQKELFSFIETLNSAVVLKDPMGSGSKNVFICNDREAAITAWNQLKRDGCDQILVEKFINGIELSLETITINGKNEFIGVTQKKIYPRTVVEQQHIFPAPNIDNKMHSKLADYALGLLEMVNYRHGPCHIEVIINNEGIHLVEINNRGGGDFIWQMVLLVSGIDVIRETLLYAFTDSSDELIRNNNKQYEIMSSIAFFAPIDSEKLKETIHDSVDVIRLSCKPDEGQCIEVRNSFDRFGFLVIGHHDKNEFQRVLPNIEKQVREAEELIMFKADRL